MRKTSGGYVLLLVLLLSVAVGAIGMMYVYSSYLAPDTGVPVTGPGAQAGMPQASPIVPIQRAQQAKGTVELQQRQVAPDLQ